jgi:hypothetical protein
MMQAKSTCKNIDPFVLFDEYAAVKIQTIEGRMLR